ncbi:MAG: HAMP domain-containing histidine kinase [Rhodospirillaceae bacterium]|nr:HAMP domain-containing histidine kinase [Rhodospirillaceae bacterium]
MPRRRGFSLKYRLLISLFVVSAIGIASAAYFAYREVYNTDEAIAERTMQGQTNELLEAIVIDAATGKASFDLPPDWAEAYGRGDGAFAYTFYEPDGAVAAKSPNLTEPLPASALPPGKTFGPLEFRGPEAQMTMTAAAPGGRRLVVARSQVESEALAESMLEESIEPMLLLVPSGILALVTIWLVGSWSLRPLERASREAADVGPGNPNARVSAEGLPAELLPLVGAVNGALDRLSRAYEAERRLTADAAHELRTPLAVLDLRLQRAQLTGEVDWRLVRRDFQHLHRVVAQLLELARMESAARSQPRPVAVNLARVVREATAMVLPLADEAGREIEIEVERDASITFPGYAADLRNMVRNLLDNALHHGRGKISVTLGHAKQEADAQADSGTVVLQVRDEGSGVPDELRETVFDRFRKGKASSAGSGLGLAIVQHVAHTHGGFARVHPSLPNCIEVVLHGVSTKQGSQASAAE